MPYFFNFWKLILDLLNHNEEDDIVWKKQERILKIKCIVYPLIWCMLLGGLLALFICDLLFWQSKVTSVLSGIAASITIAAIIYNLIMWIYKKK